MTSQKSKGKQDSCRAEAAKPPQKGKTMKEYTVRYSDGHGSMMVMAADGTPAKYTEAEALTKAGELAMKYKTYAKIYKGRLLVHAITVRTPSSD